MSDAHEDSFAEMPYCGGRLVVVGRRRRALAYGDMGDTSGSPYEVRFHADGTSVVNTVDELRQLPRADLRVPSVRDDPQTFALAYSSLLVLGRVMLIPDLYRDFFDNSSEIEDHLPAIHGTRLQFATMIPPPLYSLGDDEAGKWRVRRISLDVEVLDEPTIATTELPARPRG